MKSPKIYPQQFYEVEKNGACIIADDTKLSGAVNMPSRGSWASSRSVARVNLIRFNTAKCWVLHMGWDNPWYQYRLGDEGIESSPAEQNLGVLVGEKLDITRQCALAVQKANHIVGCIKRIVASRLKEVILPLCSVLVKPHLESCIQLWRPQHRKVMKDWNTFCEERLKELELFSLEKRRLQGDLIVASQYVKGGG